MATYVRQSSFSDGDTITAALFNNEFNQLVNAFNVATGHTHDGSTAGDGGPISNLFSNALVFGTNTDNDVVITFNANSNDGVLTWMEDEDYFQFSDDLLLTTTEKVQFRDTAIYINSSTDGQLDIVADTEVQIAATTIDMNGNADISGNLGVGGNLTVTGTTTFNGGTITMGDAATDNVVFGADVDSHIIPDDDDTYDLGSSTQEWRNLYIDGTANIDSLVADTADINGGTIDAANITVGSGKTLDVSAGSLTLADNQISGDKVEGGTINATTINTLTYGSITDGTITVTAFVDEDNMASNSATLIPTQQSVKAYVDAQDTAQDLDLVSDSGTIAIDLDGETLTVTGGEGIDTSASSNTLTITGEDATTSNKGIASFNSDDFNVSSGAVTLATTSTAAELNLLDGTTAGTIVASKGVAVDANKDITGFRNITLTGELDAGSLDVSGNVDVDGTLETDALSINGTTVTSTAAELNILDGKAFLDEDNMASNSATGIASQQSIKAYVDTQITAEDLDITTDSGTIAIDLDSETLTVSGGTGLDSSATGNAVTLAIDSTVATLTGSQTLTNKSLTAPTLTGTAVVASLDISGDIDVDGTTNLDVVDIDGAVDMASTLAVGSTTTADGFQTGTSNTNFNLFARNSASSAVYIQNGGSGNILEVQSGSMSAGQGTTRFLVANDGNTTVGGNLTVSGVDVNITANVNHAGDSGTFFGFHGDDLWRVATGGVERLEVSNSGIIINDTGVDADFRVESNNNANMLFVDGGNDRVGVGTGSPLSAFNVKGTQGNWRVDPDSVSNEIQILSTTVANDGFRNLRLRSNDIILEAGGAERLNILSGGNITIKTVDAFLYSPASSGGTTIDAGLKFESSNQRLEFWTADVERMSIASNGAATFTGAITANAGVVVDTMTLDAASLTATGSFTVDSANDITLDADGGNLNFKDGGVTIGNFNNNGNNFKISSSVSDADIIFNGNDGGSIITALTLDMSAAGAATFNSSVTSTGLTANVPSGNGLLINSADISTIKMKANGGGVKNWGFAHTNLAAGDFGIYASNSNGGDPITAGAAKLYFTSTGAATFSSSVTSLKNIVNQTGGDFAATFTTPFDYVAKFESTDSAAFIILEDNNSTDNANRIGVVGNSLQIEAGNVENVAFTSAGPVFNEAGADLDFRVESDGNANLFNIDGGTDEVRIGTNAGIQSIAHLGVRQNGSAIEFGHENNGGGYYGTLGAFGSSGRPYIGFSTFCEASANTFTTTGQKGSLIFGDGSGNLSFAQVPTASATGQSPVTYMTLTDAGALTLGSSTNTSTLARLDHENSGGKAELQLNSHGSASFSMLSNFTGSTVTGVATGNFGLVTPHNAAISIVTSGIERIKAESAGNVVINESGADADFRVESDGNANMLFVDGGNNKVGVGTSSPNSVVDIKAANSQLRLTDSDDNKFVLYSYSGGKLIVRNNSTDTTTNQFTLTEDGDFGLGTISPSSKFHILDSSAVHAQIVSSGGDAKLSLISSDSHDAWINYSGATNEMSAGYDRGNSTFNFANADTIASNIRVSIRSAGGITFNGDTAEANALDDYEEGSWTPAINLPNATVSSFGKYTKIGNLVYLAGSFGWSGHSGTAVNVVITGLPFGGANNNDSQLRPSAFPEGDLVNMSNIVDNYGHFRLATSQMDGVVMSSGNTIYMSSNNFSSSGEFNFNVVYTAT